MTPPPHLLPLALEAMTSADACEVLGDALLESGWWDPRLSDRWSYSASHHAWFYPELLIPRGKRGTPDLARAIAAVLLFGEWTEARWPLVEAHDKAIIALLRKGINAAIEGVMNREPHDRI